MSQQKAKPRFIVKKAQHVEDQPEEKDIEERVYDYYKEDNNLLEQ